MGRKKSKKKKNKSKSLIHGQFLSGHFDKRSLVGRTKIPNYVETDTLRISVNVLTTYVCNEVFNQIIIYVIKFTRKRYKITKQRLRNRS